MNRTDRLYAIVEELRAVAPRYRSARWLADRFEVSVRTVERDLSALQQAGVPIWAQTGRTGGYAIDTAATLGPMGFTPDEALAVLVAASALRRGPFRQPAASAMRKLLAVLPEGDARRATALADRVRLLEPEDEGPRAPAAFAAALRADRVVRLTYRDREGAVTEREVEPLGSVVQDGVWFLVAWCRLRGGVRAFRAERMVAVDLTAERVPARELRWEGLDIPAGTLRPVLDGSR